MGSNLEIFKQPIETCSEVARTKRYGKEKIAKEVRLMEGPKLKSTNEKRGKAKRWKPCWIEKLKSKGVSYSLSGSQKS